MLGDVDGDGDLDLIAGNAGRTNKLYRNFSYLGSGAAVSTTVNLGEAIAGVKLTATAAVNTPTTRNTHIDYFVSNNGGSTWHRADSGVNFIFPSVGNDLRWKAQLRSLSPALSPVLTTLTLVAVPDAPTIGTATAGNTTVSVTFTGPASNGGSAITGYTATCGTQSASGATSPITVTGLTNGVPVSCTVIATNAVGNSLPSAPSNSVTPQAASQTSLSAPPSSVFGQAVVLVAGVTGESPTGSVAFRNGGNPIAGCTAVALSAGSAQCTTAALAVGARQLTADYSGNAANRPSSGQFSHQVNPASTSISVSGPPRTRINTPTAFGFALAVSAPGGGTPTGTVTLTSGSVNCQVSVPAAVSGCELSFELLGVLDGIARVVFVLDDANGQAARIYARVFNGQLQYALAQRAGSGVLRLGPWISYGAEPLLSWSAREGARGWVVDTLRLE